MVSVVTLHSEINVDRVKTKRVEQLIAPLIQEVTTLTDPGSLYSLKKSGKSGAVLIAAVERTIENFLEVGRASVRECPIAKGNAVQELSNGLQSVEDAGNEMVVSGREFIHETSSSQRRARAVRAARSLLTAVARLLIMADMVDVHLMLMNIARAKADLDSTVTADSKQELSERFGALRSQLEELNETTRRRVHDLRDPAEQDDLQAARAWLKVNTAIMCTSSTAYIRHPEVDQVRLNRDFAHAEMSKALQAIADVLEGRPISSDVGLSRYGRIGDLIRELDQFQNRVYMEPSSYRAHIHRPELEELLERIVSGAAAIADSENTRDERKKRIVDECNNLRQALQDLLAEYENNRGRAEPSEDLDLAMVHLGHKAKDLRRHLRRAIVDHVSDAFLDTNTPLMMLIESAKRHDQQATINNGKLFQEHADKLVQVAQLVCQMSNNEDGIRIVRYAAIQVDKLAPQVVNAAHLLCARDSQVARDNMDAFKDVWLDKVRLLTMAVDELISVDDFLAVSEAHIIEDVKIGIQAVLSGDGYMLDRTAGGIRGRSLRVCSVVDAEMDMSSANPYTERVRKATKMLRENVINEFAVRAERVVNKLESGEAGDPNEDVDEVIEASELVHNAIKEIRNALLMNRNPEDVDSDNEYEDDGQTVYPDNRSHVSDAENQQRVMRRLPEEDKKKIQEQIDVFKIAQSKFEREVAKWDETGNDIIVLAKHMCMIMMNMTDFTRGRGPLRTTMDVIKAAQDISDAGAKLNSLAKQIGDESVESETKKDLFAYLQRITLYCQQLNITSRVKADVQQVGNELVVSGLESAMSLIQTARNLLNAVVLTVKAAYIASTKCTRDKREVIRGTHLVAMNIQRHLTNVSQKEYGGAIIGGMEDGTSREATIGTSRREATWHCETRFG
uniref:Protein humpback-1 n=1 Tax=Ascaris suum TaxID=6253 RepID=F1KVE0_ASCSU